MAWSTPSNQATGDLITAAIWNQNVVANPIALLPASVQFVFDDGGAVLATGTRRLAWRVPAKCDIDRASLMADQSGSMVADVWKDTFANYPPTNADSITASAKPTLSSAIKSEDSTLTGWTKALTAGDVVMTEIESCTTITWAVLELHVQRS